MQKNSEMKEKTQQIIKERKIYKYRRHRSKRVKYRYGQRQYNKPRSLKFFFTFSLKNFIQKSGINTIKRNYIEIPKNFSFYNNFNESLIVFKQLISFFLRKEGNITIDFSQCENTCLSALSLLIIFYKEFMIIQHRYKRINKFYKIRKFKIIPSYKDLKVKKYIHALGFYEYNDFKDEDGEVLSLDLIKGKYRNSYQENTKAKAIKQIVEFINNSFTPVNKCLTENGLNIIESLVSEILNNAEDHSINNSEWYTHGISFHEQIYKEKVVELNLVIVNFGNSMYDGFEETKKLNKDNYAIVDKKYSSHKQLFDSQHYFERESLFMLYMLNEGISRLKYKDQSRGNGTMQFLRAFADLGCFGSSNSHFKSLLNIISGHTILSCDNEVTPYFQDNHLKLSLNKEKELSLLPDKSYLKYNIEYFPGTIIECKIYFNEDFFDEILKTKNDNT